MPTRKPSAEIASQGVTRTQLAVEEELGWLFREQPTEDYGIDAHVEVVDGHAVLGRLLGLQIKSGESWFKQPANGGWWYRPDDDHVRYWLSHSLPVVVVLYAEGQHETEVVRCRGDAALYRPHSWLRVFAPAGARTACRAAGSCGLFRCGERSGEPLAEVRGIVALRQWASIGRT